MSSSSRFTTPVLLTTEVINMKSNMEKSKMGEVVKSHRLNTAIQKLSRSEIQLIQLAIIDAREHESGFTSDTPINLDAKRFAEVFDVSRQRAYEALLEAEATLFERRFTFLDELDGDTIKTRWVTQVRYKKGRGGIEIIFSPAVVNEITRLGFDGGLFTQYSLEQTAMLKSLYSIRLYELINQWRSIRKTPPFALDTFRGQMGLEDGDYERMSDFKRRVLDAAVKEINEKTDLKVSYEQVKDGSTITHFKFKILPKQKPQSFKNKESIRDVDNADMFTIDNLSDAQLARITRSPQFIKDFSEMISPTSHANKDMDAWSVEFVDRIKQNHEPFNKKQPIKNYLKY